MARMKQIYVAEYNWFSKEPRKAQIREICDICERIKIYYYGSRIAQITQIFMLPTATGFLKSRARLKSVKSVISVRGKKLITWLTDGTDYTDYFVADCNLLLHQCLAKLHIREICEICERIKTYLVILAHGLHGSHRFMLPTATSRLTKSRARLIAVNFLSSQNCFFIPAKGFLRAP